MEAMSCICCRFFSLSEDRKEHIRQKHFRLIYWQDIKPLESFLLLNISRGTITWRANDTEVLVKRQMEQMESISLLLKFSSDVGFFSLRPGRNWTPNRVQIVCDYVQCPACGVHSPTKTVTIYPVARWQLTDSWLRAPEKKRKLWKQWDACPFSSNTYLCTADYVLGHFCSFLTLCFC